MHLESGTIKDYLEQKGLTYEQLNYFNSLILENGRFRNYDNCPWIKEKGIYSLCKFKKDRYNADAVFTPIYNILGEFQGLTVRVLNKQKHDSYLKEGVSKPSCLFNIQNAYKSIIELDRVFVVEGAYDCMAMACKGFPNTVSILGTNFSTFHYYLLTSLTKNVIMCLDNDEAGNKAVDSVYRAYKGLISLFKVNIGDDPDEYLKTHCSANLVDKIEVIK